MIGNGFGKGQGFTHKATNALTKGAVPTLLVSGQSGFLANKMMGALREDGLISLPEIAVRSAATIGTWNGLPQPTTSVGTAVTKHEGDNLTGAAAQSCPQPDGVVLARDEGPQLIDFQHVTALLGQQTVRQAWQELPLGTKPFHRGLASHPVNTTQSPQAGPLRIAAQHVFTALSLIAWFWLKHAIRSTVFAVVLRLTNLIRPILDDVLAAAHSAFVCLGHLDHPAYSGLSLTTFPPPDTILSKYSLSYKPAGKNSRKKVNKLSRDRLFIERCLDMLASKGRMAIVLPRGITKNYTDEYI